MTDTPFSSPRPAAVPSAMNHTATTTAVADREPPTLPDDSESDPTTGSSAQNRIRQTARSIEDRIRRVLTPPGSAIATLRFLVVDDHPDAAEALAAVMELLGCSVRTCYDGPSAMVVSE